MNETFDGLNTANLHGQNSWDVNAVDTKVAVVAGGLGYTGTAVGGGSYTIGGTGSGTKSLNIAYVSADRTDNTFAKLFSSSTTSSSVYFSYLVSFGVGNSNQEVYLGTGADTNVLVQNLGSGFATCGDPSRAINDWNTRYQKTDYGTYVGGNITLGSTYYVVGRIYTSANNQYENIDIWVNPVLNSDGSLPAALKTQTDTSASATSLGVLVQRFYTFGTGESAKYDSIIVGESWADIAPTLSFPPGTLNVYKFLDLDGDGVYDSGDGESLLGAGWEFDFNGETLTTNGSGLATGEFDPGTYSLTEINIPAGWYATSTNPQDVVITSGQTTNVYFGNLPEPGTLLLLAAGAVLTVLRRRRAA